MTSLGQILAALEPADGGFRGVIPDNWLQGRTAYGGLSSALALHAAMASDTDLPPLRSAQVAFIGPLSGAVTITAQRLRRGRNAAFIQADVTSNAGLGLRATFVFMRDQESRVDHAAGVMPDFAAPAADAQGYSHSVVAFAQNFEFLDRRDGTLGAAEWLRWVRLKDRDGVDPVVALMAVADCLPPAALKLMGGPAPVSSLTWQINLLTPAPTTTDGWWLLRADSSYARAGSSAQDMAIWNTDGMPIAQQVQSVALFG
ncbi:hypothetical protein ASE75_07385 [Sphingomonas sp. Leaf17]|uniref:acyl-CoA thioesterase n=1 Tax=Sphingomonas sp. Leaf17 TaxID=1735683 RepID=UPI0006F9D4B9|nr:thioesterase family protein [Sphingomonas sp. Leaf17]KQM64895.1 hypothetical protein ASE75_07385 [Sphingomonas sp. Leaf17]